MNHALFSLLQSSKAWLGAVLLFSVTDGPVWSQEDEAETQGAEEKADGESSLRPVVRGQDGWRYWDAEEGPAEEWWQSDFDDADWKQGAAPLGYGEDAIVTTLDYGGDRDDKHPAAYFRLAFDLPDPKAFPGWLGQIRCDDGAVVYLNGTEVYRYNMRKGDLSKERFLADKLSSAGDRESRYHGFHLLPEDFQVGANVLAVRVHQADAGSSDLVLDFAIEEQSEAQMVGPERRSLMIDGLLRDDDEVDDYIDAWGKFLLKKDRAPSPSQWLRQLQRREHEITIEDRPLPEETLTPEELYRRCAPSVLVISGVGEGKDTEANHAGGFIVSACGLALTNHHVVASYGQQDLVTATTLDGRVMAVREVLAANAEDDLALIQLDGEGFQPVALARGIAVGSDVMAISHPRETFFCLTKGHVARHCYISDRPRTMITAEFAVGSSGSPVFNERGAVVGMVEMTSSIASNVVPVHAEDGDLKLGARRGSGLFLTMNHQMTLRYIVPCGAIRDFLFPAEARELQ